MQRRNKDMTNYEYQIWRARNKEKLWKEYGKAHPEFGIKVVTFEEKIIGQSLNEKKGAK